VGRLSSRLAPAPVILGALALLATGAIHLWLYLDRGYRFIPNIGVLFVLTAVACVLLTVALGLTRRVGIALLGAGFLLSVLGGYVLAATVGVFGFVESGQATAAWLAGVVEVGGAVALVAGAAAGADIREMSRLRHPHPARASK
jgi:hypothetical protein